MNWKQRKWLSFVLALAVTVGALAAGQLAWHKLAVAKPLDRGLKEIQGVEAANWEDVSGKSDRVTIHVSLGRVDNLQTTYEEIYEAAKKAMGRRNFKIALHDRRSAELEELYYSVHYDIQEAVSRGNFAAMAAKISGQAQAAGVNERVYVDSQRIYVQFAKGDAALYAVIARQPEPQEVK